MKPRYLFPTLVAGTLALLSSHFIWAQSNPSARIARLSFVEGEVTVARPDVQGWAEAPVNTPLEEGFRLSTGENSFVEVQLENGSTVRLGQLGVLDLKKLAVTARGGKADRLQLEEGYATFHALGASGVDSYEVETPLGIITARGAAMFRVDIDQGAERIEVFNGIVDAQSNMGSWALANDTVLVLDPSPGNQPEASHGITPDDWDRWVDDRESRAAMAQTGPVPGGAPGNPSGTAYGWSDLLEYGNWTYVPGGGYGWVPTAVGSDWAPYGSGRWCWYPGLGYTWISSEPWGWLPFHCGIWEYLPGIGWVWFPEDCGTWSPALVNWYSGSGWVGWIPAARPGHGKPTHNPCVAGASCGGAVVSTSTFRHGGALNPTNTLAVSPLTGDRIEGPKIQPTTAVMLPGQTFTEPAAHIHLAGGTMSGVAGTGTAQAVSVPSHMPRITVSQPDSTIVYDPRANAYVNSHKVTPVSPPAATVMEVPATGTAGSRPGSTLPVPVGSRGENGRPTGTPSWANPEAGTGAAAPKPATTFGPAHGNAPPQGTGNGYNSPSPSREGPSGGGVVHGDIGGSRGGGVFGGAHAGGGGVGGGSAGGGHH
jgi:hypothetical protein